MRRYEFERDSLLQVNLLLWASLPQPEHAPIVPVLRNAGLDLFAIEVPLNTPTNQLSLLRSSSLHISPNPVPDVILLNEKQNRLTLIECKAGYFGLESENSNQARGLLVAAENISSRLAGMASTMQAEVCYLVPDRDVQAMHDTLNVLSTQLVQAGLPTSPAASIGVSIHNGEISLTTANTLQHQCVLPTIICPEMKIVTDQTGDLRPLYILPWLPGAENADNRAFFEKVRAEVLSHLGKATIGKQMVLDFNTLLTNITRGVFGYWRDKQSLRGQVFPAVHQLIRLLVENDHRATIARDKVSFALEFGEDRAELMDKVRTSSRRDDLQLPLFSMDVQA